MSIAITLAQYLVDEAVEYDLVSHPHRETPSASAAASRVPADCVPALGAAYGLKVVVDDSLAQLSDIYFEAGDHSNLVHVSGTSFQKLMANARHGKFTRF
jgi:hypothetical protein